MEEGCPSVCLSTRLPGYLAPRLLGVSNLLPANFPLKADLADCGALQNAAGQLVQALEPAGKTEHLVAYNHVAIHMTAFVCHLQIIIKISLLVRVGQVEFLSLGLSFAFRRTFCCCCCTCCYCCC